MSEVKGQENHDWNGHDWVRGAMDKYFDNFYRIREKDTMKTYYIMKKLRYDKEEFWKKIYEKIEKHMYDLRSPDFEYLFLGYYDRFEEVFSESMREKMNILMERRIRQFSGTGLLKLFRIFEKENRLDNFWL